MTGETGDNRFVFVCPTWNASTTLAQCLVSVVGQSYKNWRIILIDDVSDQHHVVKQAETIRVYRNLCEPGKQGDDNDSQIVAVWNSEKRWEVANVLHGISMCEDDDIVCRIDGDDWLTDLDALAQLNVAYKQTGAEALWSAHRWSFTDRNISGPMAPDADPYAHPWVSSHLKTFRKRLINGMPYENFTNMDGDLVKRAGDQAVYLPCLHRAKRRGFVPKCLYHYTIDEQDGAVYQTDDARFQKAEADFVRARGYVATGGPWEQRLAHDTR